MLNHKPVLIAEPFGTDVIAHLQERIMLALEAGDDAEAWRLDGLLRKIEVLLNISAYPETVITDSLATLAAPYADESLH